MAAPSVVQRTSGEDNNGGTGSIAKAFASSNTVGNAIVVVGTIANTNTDPLGLPTDSQGNTYVQIGPPAGFVATGSGGSIFLGERWWIAYNIKAGANTVTMTDNNFAANMHIFEVAGLATSSAFDKSAFNFQVSTTALTVTTAATSFANELLLVVACDDVNDTYTVGTGYTNLTTQANTGFSSASQEKIVSSTGTQTATMTIGSAGTDSLIVIMTFADTSVTVPAISAVLLGTTYNTTTGTHTLVAKPTAGSLIVIFTSSSGNTATTTPTDNNGTGTYTSIATALKNTSADMLTANVRTAVIASTASTTFSHAAGTSTGGGLAVYMLTGVSGVSSAAVQQFAVQANHAASAAPAPVFGSSVNTNNLVLSAVFNATNPPGLTPKSGYTMDVDRGYATPTTGMDVMSRSSGETGTTITWGSSSASAFSSIALEMIAAGSSTSASITQVAATITATGGTQSVATVNIAGVTQSAATLTATGGTQAVSAIVVANASVTQAAATVTATGGTQTVATVNKVAISQTAATVTAAGGTQSVVSVANASITQVAATLTATGGTQAVATVNKVSVTQVGATITATGGSQTIATVNIVTIAQSHATLTATGGTQSVTAVVIANASVTQSAATITASGGTQVVSAGSIANASITQVAATVTATGGTQTVGTVRIVGVAQVHATLTATGGTQTIASVQDASITQVAAAITATGGTQIVSLTQSASILQVAATITVTGGTQSVVAHVIIPYVPSDEITVVQDADDNILVLDESTSITVIQPADILITVIRPSDEDILVVTPPDDSILVENSQTNLTVIDS